MPNAATASTQLAYRQALASYMTAVEQLKEAIGNEEPAMNDRNINTQASLPRYRLADSRGIAFGLDRLRGLGPNRLSLYQNSQESRTLHHSARADVARADREGSADDADSNPSPDRRRCIQRVQDHPRSFLRSAAR